MKLTLQMQLLPTTDQKPALLATMERFNEAATFAARLAFEAGVFSQPSIHKLAYREIRERFGLSAQMAVRAIGKAVECFKRDKTRCPTLKPQSAICYDNRILGFKGLDKVSLWVLGGRMIFPLVYGEYQGERFDRMEGQVDLVYRSGKFFLYCTVEMPENAPIEPTDFLGVDLGIVNIAVDSNSNVHIGEAVEKVRRRHQISRKTRQRKGTTGAKKQLKKLANREARFRKHREPSYQQDPGETGQRHRLRNRPGRSQGHPRPDNGSSQASGEIRGMEFLPTAFVRGVQSRPGRSPRSRGRSPLYQPDMFRLRALRSSQPADQRLVLVRAMQVLRECRFQLSPQPCELGPL